MREREGEINTMLLTDTNSCRNHPQRASYYYRPLLAMQSRQLFDIKNTQSTAVQECKKKVKYNQL